MTSERDSAAPTPKMIRLYHQLSHLLGEPEDLWVFDPQELPQPNKLRLVYVPAWPADEAQDVTVFNTLGMSDRRMPGADYFAELHFVVRAKLDKDQRLHIARFLADLTEYPFHNNLKLDWWELVPNAGRPLPGFSHSEHLLVRPLLLEEPIEYLDDPDGRVMLLQVVPVTPRERSLLKSSGRTAFLEYVQENDIDLLADREDPPELEQPKEAEKSSQVRRIICGKHGESEPCMICRHLRDSTDLGYYHVKLDPEDPDFFETALCEACDELFWAENGWTDRLFDFADWKLFCRTCFEETLQQHRVLGVDRMGGKE